MHAQNAKFEGRAIRISPATTALAWPPSPPPQFNKENNDLHAIASIFKRTKEEIEDKYKLSEKAKSLVSATEQAVGSVGSKIANSHCVSSAANWFSKTLDKASKRVAELDTKTKH